MIESCGKRLKWKIANKKLRPCFPIVGGMVLLNKKSEELKMKETKKEKAKIKKVMHEYKAGELHSGSKKGKIVSNPKQGIAIAMSEAGMKRKK